MEGAPPVDPTLGRSREIPGARDVGRNTIETLLFRGLSTPVALLLVVIQSRFLEPSGRGQFVLVVLSVTILSRLLGQLGLAVTNRLQTVPATGVRPRVRR
jgi:O-antigen/teichoic acid export membrane protein